MKAREFDIIEMAVEDGVNYGYARAFKHNDNPTDQQIKMEIQDSVMTSICEWFDFDRD